MCDICKAYVVLSLSEEGRPLSRSVYLKRGVASTSVSLIQRGVAPVLLNLLDRSADSASVSHSQEAFVFISLLEEGVIASLIETCFLP